jgi:hypothetical protein
MLALILNTGPPFWHVLNFFFIGYHCIQERDQGKKLLVVREALSKHAELSCV